MIYGLTGLLTFLLRKLVAALVCAWTAPVALQLSADGGRSQATVLPVFSTYATLSLHVFSSSITRLSFIFSPRQKWTRRIIKACQIFQVAWNLPISTSQKEVCRFIPTLTQSCLKLIASQSIHPSKVTRNFDAWNDYVSFYLIFMRDSKLCQC